ncbi:MAG: hypothetical protein M4579_005506 [Chaenotheca gracillima]|nr:MAG: hypothetical protein M4579_005506 [Chaenotheca gracillima]
MSASRNAEAVSNQPGQFGSHVERDEPLTTTGHQVGRKVAPQDTVPEFQAKTLPPGSAPSDRTFRPNTTSEVPSQALNSAAADNEPEAQTTASSTLGGASSGDVYQGLGHPGQGMTSSELRHEGEHHRKRQGQGLTGVGASVATGQSVDPAINPNQRALDKDEAVTGRGDKGALGAEEREPASAQEVAAEQSRPRDRHLHQ